MTVQEAEKAGMSDIDIALGIVTGELEDESEPDEYRDPVHGIMIVDESGLVKNREVNAVGSFLYGIQNHGTPIVGDIIFGLQNGPEILPLADAELVKFFLKDHFPLLEEVQK